MFISPHRTSCGVNTRTNILLDAEVENEDPFEVRQTHHVSAHSPVPDACREVVLVVAPVDVGGERINGHGGRTARELRANDDVLTFANLVVVRRK